MRDAETTAYRWEQRVFRWREIADNLSALEDRKPLDPEPLRQAMQLYPELARDLASARLEAPRSRLTLELEAHYSRLHRALYRAPRHSLRGAMRFVVDEVPAMVFQLRMVIVSLAVAFVLSSLAGWWLVSTYPELATLFASEEMVRTVEGGELWTDGLLNIMPSSVLSIEIFTNNIMVALTAMALGVFYGLGTLYIVLLNGLMLGGIFAFTGQYDMADELFRFVAAHGPVELSIIVVASAIGFSIGESLARPGERRRVDAFKVATARGMRLMLVCILFLVGAGLIEGYVSPDPTIALGWRIAIGCVYWILMLAVFCGALRRFSRPETAARPGAAV